MKTRKSGRTATQGLNLTTLIASTVAREVTNLLQGNRPQNQGNREQRRQNAKQTRANRTTRNRFQTSLQGQTTVSVSLKEQNDGLVLTSRTMTPAQGQMLKRGINTLFSLIFQRHGVPTQECSTNDVNEILNPTCKRQPDEIGLQEPYDVLNRAAVLNRDGNGISDFAQKVAFMATTTIREKWPTVALPKYGDSVRIVKSVLRESQLFSQQVMEEMGIHDIGLYKTTNASTDRIKTQNLQQTSTLREGEFPWGKTLANGGTTRVPVGELVGQTGRS